MENDFELYRERRDLSHLIRNYALTSQGDLNVWFTVNASVFPTQRLYELSLTIEPAQLEQEKAWIAVRDFLRREGRIDVVAGLNPLTKCKGWTSISDSLESPLLDGGNGKLKTATFYLSPPYEINNLSYLDFTLSIKSSRQTEARITVANRLPTLTDHPK